MNESEPSSSEGRLEPHEVHRLVKSAAAADVHGAANPGQVILPGDGETTVCPHDFRQPVLLTQDELGRLRQEHDDYGRYLASRLSLLLRLNCEWSQTRLETFTFARYATTLADPRHLTVFKVDPLPGVGVVEISLRLALAMVDRLLGGKGEVRVELRPLTEIEVVLLEDVLRVVLDEWAAHWRDELELTPTIVAHENNGASLQTAPADTTVVVVAGKLAIGECEESLRLMLPYYLIEPLVKAMQDRRGQAPTAALPSPEPRWNAVFANVEIAVQADWRLPDLTLREVIAWRVGDLLELPPGVEETTVVRLNGQAKFTGTVGVEADRVAVNLNRKLSPGEAAGTHAHG